MLILQSLYYFRQLIESSEKVPVILLAGVVGVARFEHATFGIPYRRATWLRYTPTETFSGADGT